LTDAINKAKLILLVMFHNTYSSQCRNVVSVTPTDFAAPISDANQTVGGFSKPELRFWLSGAQYGMRAMEHPTEDK
jgi:hypothetical protein